MELFIKSFFLWNSFLSCLKLILILMDVLFHTDDIEREKIIVQLEV